MPYESNGTCHSDHLKCPTSPSALSYSGARWLAFISVFGPCWLGLVVLAYGYGYGLDLGFVWPGGIVVRLLDLRLRKSQVRLLASRFQVTTLGKLFTHTCPCHQAVNLVPVKRRWRPATGEVTVGLASHWPCVADFSGLSTCWLTA